MEKMNEKEFFVKNKEMESLDSKERTALEMIKAARASMPAGKPRMSEADVPEIDQIIPMGCLRCSYTKTVDMVVDDWWDHPYVQHGLSDGTCGDCGVYVKSYTIVVNQKVHKDVVECWELKNR